MTISSEIPDLKQELHECLIALLRVFPALEVTEDQWTVGDVGSSADPEFKHSLLVGVKGGKPWQLLMMVKAQAAPREVRAVGWSLKKSMHSGAQDGARTYALLAAPYISPQSARICEEEGIGFLDLAGNCHLSFGGVHIHVEGKPNRHKDERGLKTLHAPKATRLLRILLQGPLTAHKVQNLADKAGVSLGLVSKVRKRLLDEILAEDTPEGIRITKPDTVLDAWAAADRWEDRTTVREYSLLLNDPAEIAAKVHELLDGQRHAFTQWFGAFLRRPYTLPVLTTVYVTWLPDEDKLRDALLARRVDSGGRLRIVLPKDKGVLDHLQTVQGLPLVSDVQLYLDLLRAGLRGDEAAAELRKSPDFSGGWA